MTTTTDSGLDLLSHAMAHGGHQYLAETMACAFALAVRYVVADIETEAARVGPPSERTWDVRPMLDEREHAPEVIDQAREALGFAAAMRVIEVDPAAPHIVRIVQREPMHVPPPLRTGAA